MEQFQNQGCGNQAGFPNVPPTPYMGFVDAIKVCFNKYATFTGRASRAEYWWWVLFTFVVGALQHVRPCRPVRQRSCLSGVPRSVAGSGMAPYARHRQGRRLVLHSVHPHRGLDSVDRMVLQALRTVPQPFR